MPSAALTLRDSAATDLPAIARIYGHWVTHGLASFELEPPGQAEMARRRAAVLDGGYPHLVAEAGGRVLGYAHAGLLPAVARKHGRWVDSLLMTRPLGAAAPCPPA